MKKVLSHIVLLAMAVPAFALMDSKDFTATVVGTATGTQSIVIRGSLEGVYVTVPTGGTGTVTIATAEQTLFSKSCTASEFYPILVPAYTSTGSQIGTYSTVTYTNTGVNDSGGTISTNLFIGRYVAPGVYTKPAMAGTVTATFVGANGAGVTNSWKATVFFDR
jgi:hypothetical protein